MNVEFLARDVLTMILAGGEGKRLYPLTIDRTKPAVPFGGHYRIIDFVLSNFVNSGFFKIKVLTQYKSDSLNKHISRTWHLAEKLGHYVEAVPAQMRTGKTWYKGSADAIFQNLNIVSDEHPKYICVFGADHIYKMDVRQMFEYHLKKNAACTIATIPVPIEEASEYGCMVVDDDFRIIGWEEKPKEPKPMPGRPGMVLASMGNYIFSIDTLVSAVSVDALMEASQHDFGKSIIPTLVGKPGIYAYDFSMNRVPGMHEREIGYWRDVGSIESYWQSNMDLVSVAPVNDIHNRSWPIMTQGVQAPPVKFVFADEEKKRVGRAVDSLVSDGCIISGGEIRRSVLSPFCRINSYSLIEESILMEGVVIGRHAKIRRTIIDKNVTVPEGFAIGYDRGEDEKRFFVSESGIVVIRKGAVLEGC